MSEPTEAEILPVKLHTLGGHAAPREVVADFLGLMRLGDEARSTIWEVLGPCLGDEVSGDAARALDRFCQAHSADPDALAKAIKAARFIVRQAAARDLSAAVIAEDFMALTSGEAELSKVLAAGYGAVKGPLRDELIRLSFADHGKLLERVDWRTEILTSSSRAEKLRVPYVVLTLAYREGDQTGRISLQMPNDAIAQLRAMCDKILS